MYRYQFLIIVLPSLKNSSVSVYVYVSSLSAPVGLGVTVTLSLRDGPALDTLSYRSADTFLMIALDPIGPYRYIFAVNFNVYIILLLSVNAP